MKSKKFIGDSWFYTNLKKHCCPTCNEKLEVIKVSKVVNSKSQEAKNYDFSLGDSFMVGDVEFIWNEFYCPVCDKRVSIDEMKQIEKKQRE